MAHEQENYELDLQKYAKAIEQALPQIPVENATIRLEAIWLETALPEDLIVQILREGDLDLPDNVERILADDGQVLREHNGNPNGRSGKDDDPGRPWSR